MELAEAVKKLDDADKAVRDDAMGVVLKAKAGAVPHLVDALGIPGAPVKKIALLLAALSAREGLPRLYELLDKGVLDVDARAVVARAFGELLDGRDAFDATAKRALLGLSRDPHATTRQLAVKAMKKVGDAECVSRLKEMAAADRDSAARSAAAAAVPGEPPLPEEGGLAVDLEALVAAQQASAGQGPFDEDAPSGPFAPLVLKLRDPRWPVRNAAVEEAVQAGKDAVPSLLEVLAGRWVSAKIGAAQALARIQAPDAARALLDVAVRPARSDDERELRPIALKALANSLTGGEEDMAQPLLPLVKDDDAFVRAGALLCLGRLADRVGARAATLALTDPHEHVKEAAAVALSEGVREEDQDLVLPLLAILGGMPSPTVAVREAILLALARIHVDDPATLLRLRHRVRPSVLGLTSSLRRTAIAVLERCYGEDDPPPTGVVDDVLGRLADDHPEVRLLAASFLATHLEPGMTGAVEKLEDALDRAETPVSLLSLEALRRHDTGKARRALEAACEDPDEVVASRAKELLEGFAPSTQEWTAAVVAPSIVAPSIVAPSTVAPSIVEPSIVEPSIVEPSRRVRPLRAGEGSGDVVEAKDAAVPSSGSLKERLLATEALPEEERARARAAVLASFTEEGS